MGEGPPPSSSPDAVAFYARPVGRVLIVQFLALAIVAGVLYGARRAAYEFPTPFVVPLLHASQGLILGAMAGLNRGWLGVSTGLPILGWLLMGLNIPAWVYLAAFLALALVFRNAARERVPLYLTNRTTGAALAQLLVNEAAQTDTRPSFIDLGCGLAGTIVNLARARPDWDFVGVESAPGPYLVAKARAAFIANVEIRFQSLWDVDLRTFDVAYAFLSPAPMARLHAKAAREMRPGALLISNSFWADDTAFDGEVLVNDGRNTRLIFKRA